MEDMKLYDLDSGELSELIDSRRIALRTKNLEYANLRKQVCEIKENYPNILALLETINKNWSHEAMFNYIKTGFLNADSNEIFKLENYCIKWGIKHNKWKNNFTYSINDENKEEIEYLNKLRKQIIEPLLNLKDMA